MPQKRFEPLRARLPGHPSGRPIDNSKIKRLSLTRPPLEGALTPRLNPNGGLTDAIGFTAHIGGYDDDE